MADTRISDAIQTQAQILTSACPFCTYALKTAAERAQVLNDLKVVDFSELIMDQISENKH
jgi:Fe-S oxidoreductase